MTHDVNDKNDRTTMNTEEKQLAWDVMTNFVESAYSQWYMNLEYTRKDVDADELDIINIKFEEYDEDTMTPVEPRRVFEITEVKVIKAMRKIASDATNLNTDITDRVKEALADQDYANLDAETDDCIVQIAAFGELVYG
jgi:hypothetical protein